MAADKKPIIVIKKIEEAAHGHHGGAWKVAFADFMTAMMAFFLVMWLLASSSEQTKQNISDYMSTPSVIEYNFQNFGAIVTLEKLFLDLINEPLNVVDKWLRPMDKVVDVLDMKNEKAVMNYLNDELGDFAKSFTVDSELAEFELPDIVFFRKGTADYAKEYPQVMQVIRQIIGGLKNAEVQIISVVYEDGVPDHNLQNAKMLAKKRAAALLQEVQKAVKSDNVKVSSQAMATVRTARSTKEGGILKFSMRRTVIDGVPTGQGSEGASSGKTNQPTLGPNGQNADMQLDKVDGNNRILQNDASLRRARQEQKTPDIEAETEYNQFVNGLIQDPFNESEKSEKSESSNSNP